MCSSPSDEYETMSRVRLLVISAEYPGPDNIYGDVFVHTRLKAYQKNFEVKVVAINPVLTHVRDDVYEGVPVFITNKAEEFYKQVKLYDPNVIVGHFVQHYYLDFLLSLNKPLAIFM